MEKVEFICLENIISTDGRSTKEIIKQTCQVKLAFDEKGLFHFKKCKPIYQ